MCISYEPLWQTLQKKGITKEDLCIKADLSADVLYDLENDRIISMLSLLTICEALECNVDAVIVVKGFSETAEAQTGFSKTNGSKHDTVYTIEDPVKLKDFDIPHFPYDEIEQCSDLVLAEPERTILAEWFDKLSSSGNLMYRYKEEDMFNYHDESWTEERFMCVFRITEDMFEKLKSTSQEPDHWLPFRKLVNTAEECFGIRQSGVGGYKMGPLSMELSPMDWTVRSLYTKNIKGIPGYLHFVYAEGSDRRIVN